MENWNGKIVKYSDPFADGRDESHLRFIVLEDRDDRVLITELKKHDAYEIKPLFCFHKDHFVIVKTNFEEGE